MPFDLPIVPFELLTEIFQKMDVTTLCRMRQTSRSVDACIEKNTSRIQARSQVPSILKIAVDGERKSLTFKVAYKAIKEEDHPHLLFHLETIPEEEFNVINSPGEQLTMIRFEYVFVDFELQRIGQTLSQIIANMTSQGSVAEGLLPQLDRLRLHGDWFCLRNTKWTNRLTKGLLEKMSFKNFYFDGPCMSRDLETWPILHCEQMHIVGMKDVPKTIGPLIRGLTSGSMVFHCFHGVEEMIAKFLKKIKKNPSLAGNLKQFSFCCIGLEPLDVLEGVYVVFDGEPVSNKPLRISRMNLQNRGVAYVISGQDSCDIKFLKEVNDQAIIHTTMLLEIE